MLKAIIKAKLAAFEKQTGESTFFMSNLLEKAAGAFYRFLLLMPLLQYHKKLPKEAYHVARIVTVKHEDCGECLQTTVTLAMLDGLNAELIKAALESRWEELPKPLNFVADFTQKINDKDLSAEDLRFLLNEVYGEAAMLELACVIASAKLFPTAKRGMGLALSCQQIQVTLPEGVPLNAA